MRRVSELSVCVCVLGGGREGEGEVQEMDRNS